ncbi:hypothetical protein DL93DRAFT_1234382 [Clavulina sp. PMI_390]|nr:hypothetical protein DL93DRAFT_1234382 [Clavulina sp. PMI_390]
MSRFFRRGGDSDSDSDDSSSSDEELLSQDESGSDAPAKSKKPAAAPAAGAKPMSRFLRTEGGSDSDSDSDSDDDSDEDEDDDDEPEAKDEPVKKRSRFLKGGSDDSDSDDSDDESTKHVVKSARDKRIEELEGVGSVIEQKVKIGDWAAINSEFDKLTRLIQRQSTLSGTTAEPTAPIYLRVLSSLEKAISDVREAAAQPDAAKKKMDTAKAKALNTMKQKLKKTIKEYETEYTEWTQNPEAYTTKWSAVGQVAEAPKVKKPKKPTGDDEDEGDDAEGGEGFKTIGKDGKLYGLGVADIYKSLAAINEARGKKATDRNEAVRILAHLHGVARTPYSRIRILLALISARFDYNAATLTHMPIDTWRSAAKELLELLGLLLDHADEYAVTGDAALEYDENVERTPNVNGEGAIVRVRGSIISFVERLDDEFTRSLQNIDPHGTEYVERLRDEKGLYEMICRAHVYFLQTSASSAPAEGDHMETTAQQSLSRTIMRRLEHVYSKPIVVVTILDKAATDALSAKGLLPPAPAASDSSPSFPSLLSLESVTELVRALCVHLYGTSDALFRTRAMLCHVYHHASQNAFHTARDLFLMSHLSEHIQNADATTQILFNRAVVQLGLCAFRNGLIREAQATLQDMFTTQRVKELLAQGVHHQTRYGQPQLTPEQERAERQRQLPFHMHINTELLEAAFLVSSMLVEIPLLASLGAADEEARRKAISKPFRRLLDFADRQVFSGPPETTRDHVMMASKALQEGEWEKCRDLVLGIRIWSLIGGEKDVEGVKEMLASRIQEEGLRTYLFTNSTHYSSLSLARLSQTFSLPIRDVTALVSKMIWSEELAASLVSSSSSSNSGEGEMMVVFHKMDVSRLQALAVTLAEKVSAMADSNSRTLESKLGGSGTGWGDRDRDRTAATGAEGGKKEGGEGQERERRSGRTGGQRGGGRGRGQRFAQGLGGRVAPATVRA